MRDLLAAPPYSERSDDDLLSALIELSDQQLSGCPEYRRVWPEWSGANKFDELPWLHVGLFKHLELRTRFDGVHYERTLESSATSSGVSSSIALDRDSSTLQTISTLAILRDFVGTDIRPLLVLDSSKSLRVRGRLPARVAAALSLKPLASEIHFLLENPADAQSMQWDKLEILLDRFDDLLVYGFTWILWMAWGAGIPQRIRNKLDGKRIQFVHSGGWKKLEDRKIDRQVFDRALLKDLAPDSGVLDYYGLVEQVGIIYPLCAYGYRHVPAWAHAIVRDPCTLQPLLNQPGQLQLLNTLARGAPYHSVLTEDVGRIVEGPCLCNRSGPKFELIGRIPKAELRGCANV